ncbi:MAG: DNA mismatch repair protein MutS [Gemmataceae bacterium]|nr:DNA mismatch repair protein MutS [Gemmataceae bacterium]MDW8265737.1 DNA mismatch repair protein MutS [Gemmataceae bacterium]
MTLTPMMQQYREAKGRHPGMLLLFRMGDFYELFDDDARLAHELLGLTLTSRDKTVAMAGFPHHQLEMYLRKLLEAGQRVAICDQVEDAAQAKGLVRREVTRIVTPGTVTEDNLLDPRQANHLVAVCDHGAVVGVAWVELSAGRFQAADLSWDRLADELARLAPSECLTAERQTNLLGDRLHGMAPKARLTSRPDWTFDPATAREALQRHFGVSTLSGFGFDDAQPCLVAAGALLQYLQETLKTSLAHLRSLRPYQPDGFLVLDEVTRRSLELTQTLRDGRREGSLLATIDRTVTAMGARLLHDWLLTPLRERRALEERLDAVAELRSDHALRQEVRDTLRQVADLQRLSARVSTGRATPRDLVTVGRTLRLLPRLKARLTARRAGLLNELEARLDLCPDLRQVIETTLVDDPPANPRQGGVIRPGCHPQLDELHAIARGGKEWIARFQASEIARTGIPSLKVGFNQVFGYYIEVTHAHAAKVPADYQRKQTLKNAERYITPELKEYEEKVLSAEEQIQQLEYELFVTLRERVASETARLQQTGEVLATLDVLAALAELAASRPYCRPEFCDEPILEIEAGRHPVLDQVLPPGTFVPNDVFLGPETGRLWLITGPNMSGKSTFIRQVALLTLLAHVGSFVPAARARIGLTDRIFTRVGASDELGRGQSTFMVEMTEAANILHNATSRSLVILDEIGRGTSTYDGVSLAWAITEFLHDRIGCRALFATHYHELAQLAESLPQLRNHNVLVREDRDEIIFLHKIAPGSADKSYGIQVARLAGVPVEVLDRAQEVLTELEAHHQLKARRRFSPTRRRSWPEERGLFDIRG